MVTTEEAAEAFVSASRTLVGIAVHSIRTAPVEVTGAQYRLLVLVATGGEWTVGDIAVQLGVNQSNATRHCDRLQRLGLLERNRSEDDGRVVRVRLTRAGLAVVDAVTRERRADVLRVLDRMSPDDVAAAASALHAFNEAARELDEERWARHQW